jgi:hypothetical protein
MALAFTWMLVGRDGVLARRAQAATERDAYRAAADRLQQATDAFTLRATPGAGPAGPIPPGQEPAPWLEMIRLMANELPAGVPGGMVRHPRADPGRRCRLPATARLRPRPPRSLVPIVWR